MAEKAKAPAAEKPQLPATVADAIAAVNERAVPGDLPALHAALTAAERAVRDAITG